MYFGPDKCEYVISPSWQHTQNPKGQTEVRASDCCDKIRDKNSPSVPDPGFVLYMWILRGVDQSTSLIGWSERVILSPL